MRNYLLLILSAAALAFTSCDDTTGSLGTDIMPGNDFVTRKFAVYGLPTASYAAGDSVLARSSISYLGRYTDPETGTIVNSDFLAQFHCAENFSFPDSVIDDKMTSVQLKLFISDYVGDSLAPFRLDVYPLNKVLDPNSNYYTNIDPTKYYDVNEPPIASRWYSITDLSIEDSARWSSSYSKNITITLPTEIGQTIYDTYRSHPEHFANTDAFVNSGITGSKGFYFKLTNGDGAIAYIDVSQFNIYFRYFDTEYNKDTLGVCQFASTEEVVQATRVDNIGLEKLMANTDATYLKSPAGIFTMATLPTDDISDTDTINSASLTFVRYNDQVDGTFKLDIPQDILLVRLDDYENGFFEKYSLTDGVTSYLTTFDATTNAYTFSNIAHLITTIKEEKRNGTASPNADKVLLIPVEATYSTYNSQSVLVRLSHNFSMTSSKLVGGPDNRVQLNVIYSTYDK